MKRRLSWLGVLAAVVAGFVWVRVTYLTDEARIRRTIRGVFADASFPTGTGNISKAAKFNGLMSRFTDDIVINVEQVVPRAPPMNGRSELHQIAQMAFSQLTSCQLILHDVSVEPVGGGVKEARAAFTASGTATVGGGGAELFTAQEFNLTLRKSKEGQWQIAHIDVVRTLRP